ncbi:MAG TPA: hypothetical protein VLH10_06855 [Yinghuangia sp.]|nr:hypothetical protein [Yinghuangia sp.]
MRVQLTPRARAFSVLGNDVLQDSGISYPALGVLVHLLSLPDGARIDVRTLADRRSGLGRQGVANALDELVEAGYYVRHTVRDAGTGRIRTETLVRDTRHDAEDPSPLPVPAGTGRPAKGASGAFPYGKKNLEKEPTRPAPKPASRNTPRTAAAVLPKQRRVGGAPPARTPRPRPQLPDAAELPGLSESSGRGIALLARLGRYEPRLALGATDTLRLARLAELWLDTGVSESATRAMLTEGLPQVIHSPAALLADRLKRKLPAPRRESAAEGPALAECPECRDPLPRGQSAALCRTCSGAAACTAPTGPPTKALAAQITELRAMVAANRGHAPAVV